MKPKSARVNIENTKAQMRKGILEFCILSLLADTHAYASDIIEQLKSAELIVVEGTLYPLLTRLKNAGMLHYHWEESSSGPPRKYYTLTQMGKASLLELQETWGALSQAVNQITQRIKNQHNE